MRLCLVVRRSFPASELSEEEDGDPSLNFFNAADSCFATIASIDEFEDEDEDLRRSH